MTDVEFCHSFQLRFGFPVRANLPVQQCAVEHCNDDVDERARHAFTCRKSKGLVTGRHTSVLKTLETTLRTALSANGSSATVEHEPHVIHYYQRRTVAAEGTYGHRADIAVAFNCDPTDIYLLDVTIRQPNNDCQHATTAGLGASKAERDKLRHYTTHYVIPNDRVIPFAFETSGRLGLIGMKFLRQAAKVASGTVPHLYNVYVRRFYEALSINIHRMNSMCVNSFIMNSYMQPNAQDGGVQGNAAQQ